MPNLRSLHNKLQKLSNQLEVSFRVFRFQGVTLIPNPRVKAKSINNRNRAQATSYPVNEQGFEGFQVFMDPIGLASSGIDPNVALAPAATWEMSNDGLSFFEVVIFNKPIMQSSRFIATFLRKLANANLRIEYPVQTGGLISDQDGNPVAANTTAELLCLMDQSRASNSASAIPGVTASSIRLSGRCLSPLAVPEPLKSLRQYSASLADNASGTSLQGRFIMVPSPPEIWTPNAESQGSKIEGWFTLTE